MDSLTQLALGAAVGEIVLGKKAGNRAMLWGAVGGTIPDLDILANFVTDEMTALAFHRSITHSFLFAFTAPLLFGWLTEKFYSTGIYKAKGYKTAAMLSWFLLLALVGMGVNVIPKVAGGDFNIPTIFTSLLTVGAIMFLLWRNYYRSDLQDVDISWKSWAWLFFWSIFTHPLLDACTAYGTQLFQPFSDYRVAFNNISVVDPIYTIPLLIGISIAGFLSRKSPKRRYLNYAGVVLSCLYLAYSFYNKHKVDQIFEKSLVEQNIDYSRYRTAPTILNNILWLGVAQSRDTFYLGLYALTDKEPRVKEFTKVAQNKHLLEPYKDDEAIRILKWFSDEYYGVLERSDGQLQFNDLRFGFASVQNPNEDEYVFKFILKENADGTLAPYHKRDTKDIKKVLDELFSRLEGI